LAHAPTTLASHHLQEHDDGHPGQRHCQQGLEEAAHLRSIQALALAPRAALGKTLLTV
jgi:hypothetical protein